MIHSVLPSHSTKGSPPVLHSQQPISSLTFPPARNTERLACKNEDMGRGPVTITLGCNTLHIHYIFSALIILTFNHIVCIRSLISHEPPASLPRLNPTIGDAPSRWICRHSFITIVFSILVSMNFNQTLQQIELT